MKPQEDPRFRFARELGRGGTAQVSLVYVDDLHVNAALKRPQPSSSDKPIDFSHLAEREFQLIGAHRFPGLVRLLEMPHHDPDYLLLEYCPGPTLDQTGRVDDLPLALNLISAIAVNLEYLRSRGLIHGDLKPHNVFLPMNWQTYRDDKFFRVKLSDFSLGRWENEQESARAGLGTVGYLAPETISSSRTSFRSDLFALGVIAYQMLTGKHPFLSDDSDPVRVNAHIVESEPDPLTKHRSDIPAAIVSLVNSLLSKDEENRPESGWQVCVTLRELGCQYPFEKALSPVHLLTRDMSYGAIVNSILSVNPSQLARLDLITGGDAINLRLVLTANFRQGRLTYGNAQFTFNYEIYWPSRMRRRLMTSFRKMPLTQKKSAIVTAVTRTEFGSKLDALPELLLPMLHVRTVRHISLRMAPVFEKEGRSEDAARLYLLCGLIDDAERCTYEAAVNCRSRHEYDHAIALAKRTINFGVTAGRENSMVRLLMLQGDLHKHKGEADSALGCYTRIIRLYENRPPDGLLAETYKDLGDIYKIKQDHKAGLAALEKALEAYTTLGDNLEISHTLNNMGNIHWIVSELSTALRLYRRALAIQRRLNVIADVASTLSNIGSIYCVIGRFARSIRVMDLSLRLKRDIGNPAEIARTLNNLGYTHHVSGNSTKAIEQLTESLEINRRIGSRKEALFNLDNLTSIMIVAGRIKDSLTFLSEGMSLSEELGDKPHLGAFNLTMAIALMRLGRFSSADQALTNVESRLQEVDDHMLRFSCRLQRAWLRYHIGDLPESARASAALLKEAADRRNLYDQLNAMLLLTRLDPAAELVGRAGAIIDELKLEREKALLTFGRIEALIGNGQTDSAHQLAVGHIPYLLSAPVDLEFPWMANLAAELLISVNSVEQAAEMLELSYHRANATGLIWEAITALTLLARLDSARGDFENGFSRYKQALQLCKSLAQNLENDRDRACFQNRRIVLFLVDEIRRLGKLLGQKQRAGDDPALVRSSKLTVQ